MLTIYNTLTNKEEEFVPLQEGKVTMYTCGPTVYGRPHIGNYSSFLMADLLRRWLEVSGYEVAHAKNITDVGHLTGDSAADATGEDKIERQAREEMQNSELKIQNDADQAAVDAVLSIAQKYTDQYLEDEAALNMLEPHHRPKATEYVEQMKQMTESLLESGHAYVTSDGIYFDVETFQDYGRLSGNTLDNLNAGARVQVDEQKKHPADFALWKFCVGPNADHVLRWSSPGEGNPEGFPGWHIECSAMSSSLLGDQIDIHTGGEDNIFPHHECEIAQSECCSNTQFVGYWVHRRRIDMGTEKMSKSLGNVLSIPDIVAMGYSPLDIRYLFLSVHYRTQLKFTEKGLEDARKARRKIVEWIDEIGNWELGIGNSKNFSQSPISSPKSSNEDLLQMILSFQTSFTKAMNADLNTPAALATVFDAITWVRKQEGFTEDAALALSDFIEMVTHTFGCFENDFDDGEVPTEVQTLLEERQVARDAKDYQKSDELRDAITSLGYEVKDGLEGQVIKKI